jgi:hypothetical protein
VLEDISDLLDDTKGNDDDYDDDGAEVILLYSLSNRFRRYTILAQLPGTRTSTRSYIDL